MFADVAFPQRRFQVFTYRVPNDLIGRLQVGSRVLVPLGRASAQGLVLAWYPDLVSVPGHERMDVLRFRAIAALIDTPTDSPVNATLIMLASRVADYYCAPPGSVLRFVLPPSAPRRIAKRVVLTAEGKQALEQQRATPDQVTVLARLQKASKGLTPATLLKHIQGNRSVLAGMKRRGWIEDIEFVRPAQEREAENTLDAYADPRSSEKPLSPSAKHHAERGGSGRLGTTLDAVHRAIAAAGYHSMVITAEPTECEAILVCALRDLRQRRRAALILCPEVQRAEALAARLQEHVCDPVTLFYSDMSVRARAGVWHAIHSGSCPLIVGTRSTVFAPLPDVGLIWMEQEENPSYQEEQAPYYHTRVVAMLRAQVEDAVLVCASTHPSLDACSLLSHDIRSAMPERQRTHPPVITAVDRRDLPYGELLSDQMADGMAQALAAKEPAVLLYNRKGYARALVCKDCGAVATCSSCGVALTLYQHPARMRCAYCGRSHVPPTVCPGCQSVALETSGHGTERVEETVARRFPDAVVARFDRETVRSRAQEKAIIDRFRCGEIDILIGTELLLHADAMPSVVFLGIPHADAGLHFPDFRAAERTFHHLMDALALVRPREVGGAVVLHTLLPTHHVIESVTRGDPLRFYQEEQAIREALRYPPHAHLIQMTLVGKRPADVQRCAARCREHIVLETTAHSPATASMADGGGDILGPLQSTRRARDGRTRSILVLKTGDGDAGRRAVRRVQQELRDELARARVTLEIRVDPAEIG